MKVHTFLILLGAALVVYGCSTASRLKDGDSGNTIPNFAVVQPGIARGGQPATDADWAWLYQHGYTNDVKLNTGDEAEDSGAVKAGLALHYHPVSTFQQLFNGPDPKDFSNAVVEISMGGVFVHCGSDSRTKTWLSDHNDAIAGGNDRTGLAVGCLRLEESWPSNSAYAEMLKYGFHPALHGLHEYFENQAKGH